MRALLSFAFAALLVAFGCVGVGRTSSMLPLGYVGSSGGGGGGLALDGKATDTATAGTVTPLTTTHTNDSIIIFAAINAGSVTSITGGGLTFSRAATSGGANPIEVWCAPASGTLAGASLVVNNSGSFVSASGFGVSGAVTPCTFDTGGPQTSGTTPPAITTAVANTFIIGVARGTAGCTTGGAPWTIIYDCTTSGSGFILGVYDLVSSTGTYTPSVSGTFNGGITDALK